MHICVKSSHMGSPQSESSPFQRRKNLIWMHHFAVRECLSGPNQAENRGGLVLAKREIGLLSVSSLFLTQVGVYVGMCMCIRTHTHTAHMGYSIVSPGVGMRHLA